MSLILHFLFETYTVELRQCVGLVELSPEHNKLIRSLLDFRAMAELRILRLFDRGDRDVEDHQAPIVGLPFMVPPMLLTGELFKAWSSCS
ncbi:hypothetical protein L2E82_33498 [Cichorium intybus]|uniref:Uncharacterized protein n=1 Tax=Cichorium intybus TaxID=13427 RepID=A0ACB9BKB5_CICIN|nr:hypothetical protein L2E82_33498 [Cichorium intybus]